METFENIQLILSAVFGAISLGLFVAFPVLIIAFFVRRIEARKFDPKAAPSWITLVLYLAFVGICGNIFVNNFLTFNVKARQVEAKTNLEAISTAQKSYYSDTGNWAGVGGGEVFSIIGWFPAGTERYSYYCGDDMIIDSRYEFSVAPSDPEWRFNVKPLAGKDGFLCLAVGNIDADEFIDVWKITQDSEPYLAYNDVENEIREPGWDKNSWLGPAILFVLEFLIIFMIARDGIRYRKLKKLAQS